MASTESWQAVQNWSLFVLLLGGLAWYYSPTAKKTIRQAPPAAKEVKEKVKKAVRNPEPKQTSSSATTVEHNDVADKSGTKKRKANDQKPSASLESKADDEEIDMSTRQFAQSMTQARQGIQVKSNDKSQQRVKTVKTGNAVVSSGSSQADGEDDWSSVVSPAPQAGVIDDMLEPTAAGPTSLRITPAQQPVRERAPKQAKKVEVETKKQRQNRKKVEERRAAREAEEAEQNKLKENQRRTAREARGEPAKNGIVSAAPSNNPWAEKNAARDVQLPVQVSERGNTQLLDTFETESNSSSNQEVSTAATSTTDAAPSRWADDLNPGEDDYAKALQESERETGWNEVKSNKKANKKTQPQTNGVGSGIAETSSNNNSSRFGALKDEGEQSASIDDPSNWAA